MWILYNSYIIVSKNFLLKFCYKHVKWAEILTTQKSMTQLHWIYKFFTEPCFKKGSYSRFDCPPYGRNLCSKPKAETKEPGVLVLQWPCQWCQASHDFFLNSVFLSEKQCLAISHRPYDGYCDYYYFMVILWRLHWLWRLPRPHQALSDFFPSIDFREGARVGRGNQKSHPDSSCLQWKETLQKVFFAFSLYKFSAGNQELNWYFVVLHLSTDYQEIAVQNSLGMNLRAI